MIQQFGPWVIMKTYEKSTEWVLDGNWSVNGLSRSIQKKISLVVGKRIDRGEGKDLPNKIPPRSPKLKRCRLYMNKSHGQWYKETKSNINKHSSQCQKYGKVICEKHSTQICHNCLEWERTDYTIPCKNLVAFFK